MTKYRIICCTFWMLAFATGAENRNAAAAAPPAYIITDLGTLGGTFSWASGINASGQVTGSSHTTGDAEVHTFLWTPTTPNGASGTMQDLGGGAGSTATGVNASGQVTGYSSTPGDDIAQHAFLYDGAMHDLGTFGGADSYGLGVNDSGHVAGYSFTTGDASRAFLYDGTLHDLGTLGGFNSAGLGINASGQVTGNSILTANSAEHAFLWIPTTPNGASGTMHDLGTLGGRNSAGVGINASGQVTGSSELTDDRNVAHAFLWTPTTSNGASGAIQDLGTLGGTYSRGTGINANGHVAGFSRLTGTFVEHAFLYTSAIGMVDLNSLIDPLSGWELLQAKAINDAGQITGYGIIGGQERAFLLTPVPEPASLALLALGLPFLLGRNLRRFGSDGSRGAYGPMTVFLKL